MLNNVNSNSASFGARILKIKINGEMAALQRQLNSKNKAEQKTAAVFIKREMPTIVPEGIFSGILKHLINLPK